MGHNNLGMSRWRSSARGVVMIVARLAVGGVFPTHPRASGRAWERPGPFGRAARHAATICWNNACALPA